MDAAFDDEIDQTVTINEYIDKIEAEELEADLVLGGDEGKECTYPMGYVKRQAIFSCLTCTPNGNAGVCTACSLSCHDGHEVVELWTKRNFRCDCGNSKFKELSCKLLPSKDEENIFNTYNHNFRGLYCSCEKPYPDPNAEEQEEMIQCIICEDWFHEEHLGLDSSNELPRDEEGVPSYEDFICKKCSNKCSFLTLYPQKIWATVSLSSNSGSGHCSTEDAKTEQVSACLSVNTGAEVTCPRDCVLDGGDPNSVDTLEGPLFLSKSWRDLLCYCQKCLEMYSRKDLSYLLDRDDSIAEYEKAAERKREEKLRQQEGAEMSFFNKLGHVEKIEILRGITDFKEEFVFFLDSFDKSKTITCSDISKFFDNLGKKRKRAY